VEKIYIYIDTGFKVKYLYVFDTYFDNLFIFKCIKYTYFTHVLMSEIQAHVAQNKEQEDIGITFEQHL
jgi:hypothetical protein